MAKRFISPDWKLLRRLPEHLQRAWFYIWDKADACGVYTYDPDYLKLDLSLPEAPTLADLASLPNSANIGKDRVLLTDFIQVNYSALKVGYNPHKPAFRDLERNKLNLNSSLNQACVKLEEEDKDEEEDVKGVVGGNEALPITEPLNNVNIAFLNSVEAFEVFWKAYGKNVERNKCEHAWYEMTTEERAKAIEIAPAYVANLSHVKFKMQPLKWLEGKYWNDPPPPKDDPNHVSYINPVTGGRGTMPREEWARNYASNPNNTFILAQ